MKTAKHIVISPMIFIVQYMDESEYKPNTLHLAMMMSLLLSLTQVPNIHIQILPTDSLTFP